MVFAPASPGPCPSREGCGVPQAASIGNLEPGATLSEHLCQDMGAVQPAHGLLGEGAEEGLWRPPPPGAGWHLLGHACSSACPSTCPPHSRHNWRGLSREPDVRRKSGLHLLALVSMFQGQGHTWAGGPVACQVHQQKGGPLIWANVSR